MWVAKPARRPGGPRIVSLAPDATSILVALGARGNLIAVSRWCKDVAEVAELPQLGDCWALTTADRTRATAKTGGDTATIQRLRPDYIIGSVPLRAETVEQVLGVPATFIALNPRSLRDIFREIEFLGCLVNRAGPAAALIHQMEETFAGIQRRVPRRRARPRVYCEAWPKPRISSPPWVAELVKISGGRLAVPCGQQVTDAQVARAKPDVIVLAWTATGDRAKPQSALANNSWRRVPAVRNGRIAVVRDEWLNTPGPPLMKGAEALFRALHGEA
jgi:iron complex transport system substrate-binding protein